MVGPTMALRLSTIRSCLLRPKRLNPLPLVKVSKEICLSQVSINAFTGMPVLVNEPNGPARSQSVARWLDQTRGGVQNFQVNLFIICTVRYHATL